MLRKIHSIFHPSSHRRSLSDGIPAYDGSAVRLIRSTSMYVIGGEEQKFSEPLKKSKSITSFDSVACGQLKEEERAWMYSKTQDCLQYLQDLLALRKKYLESIKDMKSMDRGSQITPLSTKSSKNRKKPPAQPPPVQSSKLLPAQENTASTPTGFSVPLGDIPRIFSKQQRQQANLEETAKEEQSAPERNYKDTQCISLKLWRERLIL
ncbi:hypothetical protein JD844_023685 [Phrynosoma platyrhinos]|uniref:Uncharacterized protein n=1 Tax=Phrynosoma platyrhinos TaxID=52577 RepID=A0ABQ7SXG6_PHRPL|nr:hypothetical protein JD844_023685 [Phrynosoma platyrhinos]